MNIRRFRARNVSEALSMVKAELGDDAVILNTSRRRIRQGQAGAAISIVEVVAAIDFDVDALAGNGDSPSLSSDGPDRFDPAPSVETGVMDMVRQGTASTGQGHVHQSLGCAEKLRKSADKKIAGPDSPDRAGGSDKGSETGLRHEIEQLKALIERMLPTAGSVVGAAAGSGDGSGVCGDSYTRASMPSSSRYPLMVIHEVFDLLGMEPAVQRSLAAAFLHAHPARRPVNHRSVYSWLRGYCKERIVCGPVAHSCERPCWWAFIGPTGVGKTTTLAKVAAHLKFRHGLAGHLVTLDTYRLGGVEQLQKYASLMEIPFSTARNTGELVRVFSENRDLDFILVDTIGRNSSSARHQAELEKMFDAVPGLSAQAFICASYRAEDMAATVRTYRRFPVSGWTISKVDETGSPGALCTPVLGWRLPLSYITNGQKVPEDIKSATRENVMKLLFARGDTYFARNGGQRHPDLLQDPDSRDDGRHAAVAEGRR